jgi:isochorismate synthase
MGPAPEKYTLDSVFKTAVDQHLPAAVWRLPNSPTIQACMSLQPDCVVTHPDLEQNPFGFLFCPFQVNEQHQNQFIKGDLLFDTDTNALTTAPDAPTAALKRFCSGINLEQDMTWHTADTAAQHSYQSESGFTGAVDRAVEAIGNGRMEKVVMSRNYLEQLPEGFNPITAFKTIMSEYPGAFVSLARDTCQH